MKPFVCFLPHSTFSKQGFELSKDNLKGTQMFLSFFLTLSLNENIYWALIVNLNLSHKNVLLVYVNLGK